MRRNRETLCCHRLKVLFFPYRSTHVCFCIFSYLIPLIKAVAMQMIATSARDVIFSLSVGLVHSRVTHELPGAFQ